MSTLQLKENDLEDMKMFYTEELNKTLKKLQHIKSVLDTLDAGSNTIRIEVINTPSLNPISAKTPKRTYKKRKQKTGPKSVWEDIITKRLKHVDKPLTYEELTDEIMSFGKLSPEKRKSTKQAIVNVIFRLRKSKKKLDTYSVGTKEKYIALKPWFESPGMLKTTYQKKIKAKKAPVKSKKRVAKK